MKKLLLIALSLFAASTAMSAKELSFTFDGQPVANGATVEFGEYEELDFGTQTAVFIEPLVYITKDALETVNIRTTANYPVQVCIGGECTAAENILKEKLSFPPNTPTDLQLDAKLFFDKGEEVVLPAIEVLIEAWYTSTPGEITSMTVKMGDIASVQSIIANANVVVPAGKNLNYNFNASTDITVFNLSGRAVAKQRVQGTGSLNLSSLPVGIYLYRAGGLTGKFILR